MKNCVQATGTIGWQMERDELCVGFFRKCASSFDAVRRHIWKSKHSREPPRSRSGVKFSTQIDWKRWIIDAIDHFTISCKVFSEAKPNLGVPTLVSPSEIVFHSTSLCQPWKLRQIDCQIPARVWKTFSSTLEMTASVRSLIICEFHLN